MIIIGREKKETKKQNMDRPTMTIKAVYLCILPIPQKSSDCTTGSTGDAALVGIEM